MRSLRGRITTVTVPDDPYMAVWDADDDPEDDESLRTHRSPTAAGLSGWGPVAPVGPWASREHRADAIAAEADRRLARRS